MKIVLHHEVSQLVCDVFKLIGLFISGSTIGLLLGEITLRGLTFSCVMLKYGRMSSHSKIFKVSLAIYLYLPDCFEKNLSNTQLVRIEMN